MPGPNTGYPFANTLSLPAGALNGAFLNAYTDYYGTTPPANPSPGWKWWDSSQSPVLRRIWDGAEWVSAEQLDTTGHLYVPAPQPRQAVLTGGAVAMSATAGFVLVNATSSVTLTLAGIGPVIIKDMAGNFGTYPCTIMPGSGLIDGLTSLVLLTDRAAAGLIFDGTNWGRFC